MGDQPDSRAGALAKSVWVVGLDLRSKSQGAVKFAAWLARHGRAVDELIAVHVLEDAHVRAAERYHKRDELLASANEAAGRVLAGVGVADAVRELQIVQGGKTDESLETVRNQQHANGIVVGRHAHKEGRRVFRLGAVARRLLRRLASPVIVVPPDCDPETDSTPDGPVICTVSMAEECESAIQFARSAANRWERPLVLAHVVALPDDYGASYIPEAALATMREEHQQTGERELAEFAVRNGVDACERVILQGSVVESLVEFATARHACLLVTGSRRLSTLERILLTSVGSELAASAHRPVAVIPPVAVSEAPTLP